MGKTVADLDERVQHLLNELQNEVPLVERPYRALGEKVGLDEFAVLDALYELKEQRILRQVSTIFDTRSLGYLSSLVAAKAAPEEADRVAAVLNEHPGVSHNYARRHHFNLWFTIAIPGDSSLEEHIEILRRKSGAESIRLLPTLHLFKIGMKLDTTGGKARADNNPHYSEKDRRNDLPELTAQDIAYIRALQLDMEVRADPYTPIAQQLGTTLDELFAWCKRFQRVGRMRRVAGIMNHRIAGFKANGMGVWKVPEERIEEVGNYFSTIPEVTHCYLRPTYPDWPYNIFSMVHSGKMSQCDAVLEEMSKHTGIADYATLYSFQEYKKVRLLYFTGEIARWERDNGLKSGRD